MTRSVRLPGIEQLVNGFDAFVLDQWGVLHDGNELYSGVLDALGLLQESGKRVLVLTNSSKTASRNVCRLEEKFNLPQSLYGNLISSAQLLRDFLAADGPALPWPMNPGAIGRVFVIADEGDEVLIEGLPVTVVDNVSHADAIVLLSLPEESDDSESPSWIDLAIKSQIPLLCPSCDLHSVRPSGLVLGMAEVISEFERRGGEVVNFGKPSEFIYRYCASLLDGIPAHRVLAVGDQIASDVLGARQAGWRSALVETGAGLTSLHRNGVDAVCPDYIVPTLRR